MCIVCVMLDKDRLTKREARAALREQVYTSKDREEITHMQDIHDQLHKEITKEEKDTKDEDSKASKS